MTNSPVCRAEHINHIGIAVKDIDSTLEFYKPCLVLFPVALKI